MKKILLISIVLLFFACNSSMQNEFTATSENATDSTTQEIMEEGLKSIKTNKEQTAELSLVGEWVGVNKDKEEFTWVFMKNGKFTIIIGNSVMKDEDLANEMAGKYKITDKKVIATYKTDFSRKPGHFDIIFKANNEEFLRWKGIIEFLSENKIRFYMPAGEKDAQIRPDNFDSVATTVFTRK